MTTSALKEKILKFPQIKFNKVQKKKPKHPSAFSVQDWSHIIFKTCNNNHAIVYINERSG